ncbi:MAG: prepilin-type N-terminal cleavage/methylation domain-containing protein [Planctomycetota bacterium]
MNHASQGLHARRGFSMIEMLLVLALVGVITTKLAMVLQQASEVHRTESSGIALQDQANRVIDQIAWKVLSARRESLTPAPEAPDYAVRLRYQVHMGFEDGEVVMGDPEVIGLTDTGEQVYWGLEDNSRTVVWCNTVANYLMNEIGGDDLDNNENSLFDEAGLAFDVDRDLVRIQLTLRRLLSSGEVITFHEETAVTCRN